MREQTKEQTNVTLSLPENLLRRFRVFAATRNQSMSSLMTVGNQRHDRAGVSNAKSQAALPGKDPQRSRSGDSGQDPVDAGRIA